MILYAGNILSRHGFTPTFIETLTPKLSEKYEILSVSEKKFQILRLLNMTQSLIKNRSKIKLVLIDSYSRRAFWYTYILAKLSKFYNIPYIPILRGGGYPDRLKQSPGKCRFIFSYSAANISPSLYLKKKFEEDGYAVNYIPNFIPLENYYFKERKNIQPKLFWVRSFHQIYNPLLAVEIFSKLKSKFPNAELCMVGPDKDGTLQKVIDAAKEKGLSNSLKLTGKLSKEDWIKLSKDYDIFINTTDFDNHPVSVIEAMALGLPVISTDVGGIPFLIRNNTEGMLVKPDNADEFVNQIVRLINEPELALKITKKAREAVEQFDWEILKFKWFELIDGFTVEKNADIKFKSTVDRK